jgi:hypothetical protein
VLVRLRAQLLSAQPAPKRLKPRLLHDTGFRVGDALRYRLADGRCLVFVVVDETTERSGTAPVVHVLDWIGEPEAALPSTAELEGLPTMGFAPPKNRPAFGGQARLTIYRNRVRPDPHARATVVASGIRRTEPYSLRHESDAWHTLDAFLQEHCGV